MAHPAPNERAILVSKRQDGNAVLKFLRNVPWEYSNIVPDYQMGSTACALFLSLKFHALQPGYLAQRVASIKHHYKTRVILALVDILDSERPLGEITQIAFNNNWALILGWAPQEIARYLETFKAYEHKDAELIKMKVDKADPKTAFTNAITTIRSVNKRDASVLASSFGSFARIALATSQELSHCPGLGPKKVARIRECFTQPFISSKSVSS